MTLLLFMNPSHFKEYTDNNLNNFWIHDQMNKISSLSFQWYWADIFGFIWWGFEVGVAEISAATAVDGELQCFLRGAHSAPMKS